MLISSKLMIYCNSYKEHQLEFYIDDYYVEIKT